MHILRRLGSLFPLAFIAAVSVVHLPAQAQADQQVERGFQKFLTGDYKGAILIFDRVIRENPNHAVIHDLCNRRLVICTKLALSKRSPWRVSCFGPSIGICPMTQPKWAKEQGPHVTYVSERMSWPKMTTQIGNLGLRWIIAYRSGRMC